MEIIINNWKLSLLIIGFLSIALLIGFKIFVYGTNKYFHYEMTWVLQKTVFKSYIIPIILLYGFILLFSLICISLIYDNELKFLGYISLGITIFLLFKMYNITKNNKLNIKENFEFQRYTTKISYYNDQSQEYKIKSYNSIIDRIKKITFNTIDNEEYKTVLIDDYLLNIESLITFEYFDVKIYNSISDHTTGVLFYSKFHKNILEILSRINKLTNDLQSINNNYEAITSVLSSVELIKFDDNQGLHYDIKLLDIEIKKLFIINNEQSGTEKGLVVVNKSLENIQVTLEDNYHTTSDKINKIQSQLNKHTLASQLKTNLKIKIDKKDSDKFISKFIDLKFSYKTHSQIEELKLDFGKFILFFHSHQFNEIPYIRNISKDDIKELLIFFNLYSEVFEFKLKSLIELLLLITNNNDYPITTFEKVHLRYNINLSNVQLKELERIIPKEFRSVKISS